MPQDPRRQEGPGSRANQGRKLAGWLVAVSLALGALSVPLGSARAQGADDQSRSAARALANQAADAYEAGDYETAADLFRRAYLLMPVPSLSVYLGRALEQTGRLVDALEAYQLTARARIDMNSPAPFRRAVLRARRAIDRLEPRIPRLRIEVSGPGKDDPNLEVRMDGKPVKRLLIGVDRPVNPGAHELEADTPLGARATGSVTLDEGERKVVELRLAGGDSNAAGAPTPAPTQPVRPSETPADEQTGEETAGADVGAAASAHRTWGYVGLGVGAAGLGVGVVTGLMAVGKHKDAVEACPDLTCEEGTQGAEDVEAFRSLRTISTIGYVAGVLGVGAGVSLLLTAPSSQGNPTARITPCLGLGAVGLRGRF